MTSKIKSGYKCGRNFYKATKGMIPYLVTAVGKYYNDMNGFEKFIAEKGSAAGNTIGIIDNLKLLGIKGAGLIGRTMEGSADLLHMNPNNWNYAATATTGALAVPEAIEAAGNFIDATMGRVYGLATRGGFYVGLAALAHEAFNNAGNSFDNNMLRAGTAGAITGLAIKGIQRLRKK